ncbi:MAG TPA: hypothetical protein VJ866_02180 [Pyrinomonadaceae bacterium]|nr:hypothetical protein [Pyrinomonadaceae bacterium]
MEELVRQVAERTGISPEQAQTAVVTVLGFLKNRLPEPIAGQLEGFLGGGAGAAGGLAEQASGMLGGLLGGGNKE